MIRSMHGLDKIALAHYLHKIQRQDSPRCPCSQGIQTVRHILTECPRTQDLWEELLGQAQDVKRILKDSALVKAAAILVLWGNLLRQFQEVTEALGDLEAEKPLRDPGTDGSMTAIQYWLQERQLVVFRNIHPRRRRLEGGISFGPNRD